jgi:hypothetical protein
MRAAICLLALLFAGLGSACASSEYVFYDEREDLSRYHTWSWLPHDAPSVDAPHAQERAIDARLARVIERELAASGFARSAGRPDFYVAYHLALERYSMVVDEPRAPYLLSSLTSSPSYLVEGSRKATRVQEQLRLAIRFVEPEGRMLWQAGLVRVQEDHRTLPLDRDVASLLARFPRPAPPEADAQP